jgi:hypothetical protein
MDVAEEWLALQSRPNPRNNKSALSVTTIKKKRWLLEDYLYPPPRRGEAALKDLLCREITSPQLLKVLRAIEAKGKYETAHRTRQHHHVLCDRDGPCNH